MYFCMQHLNNTHIYLSVCVYNYIYTYKHKTTHRSRGCKKLNEGQPLCNNDLKIPMGSWDVKVMGRLGMGAHFDGYIL